MKNGCFKLLGHSGQHFPGINAGERQDISFSGQETGRQRTRDL